MGHSIRRYASPLSISTRSSGVVVSRKSQITEWRSMSAPLYRTALHPAPPGALRVRSESASKKIVTALLIS